MSITFASGRWFVMKECEEKHLRYFATTFQLTHTGKYANHTQSFCTKWRRVLWLFFLFRIHNATKVQFIFSRDLSAIPLHPIQNAHQISLEPVCSVFTSGLIGSYWRCGSRALNIVSRNVNGLPAANGPCCNETEKILTDSLHTSHCSNFRRTDFSLSPFISSQP